MQGKREDFNKTKLVAINKSKFCVVNMSSAKEPQVSQSREKRIQLKMKKEDYLLLTNYARDKTIKIRSTICILLKRSEYPVLYELDLFPALPGLAIQFFTQ